MPTKIIRTDKKRPGNNGWWSDKERYQAVSTYLVVGKLSLTAAATGIPEDTLKRWHLQPWWKEYQAEILKSSKIELNSKIMKVINKSMAVLEDRLENGDFFFNPKTGAFERRGVSANVANKIANDLISKNVLMDKIITEESKQDEGLDERLQKLKDEMLRFARSKDITGESNVVSVEPIQESVQEEGATASSDVQSPSEYASDPTGSPPDTGTGDPSSPTDQDSSAGDDLSSHPQL